MVPAKPKKRGLFSKVDTRDQALQVIKECAGAFLGIAIIQGIIGFFVLPSSLIDAILFAILGLALWFLKSRIVAVILLLLSGLVVVTTFLNRIAATGSGGTNIFLALIIFWAGVKAVEATFKLHGKFAHGAAQQEYGSTDIGYTDFDASSYEKPEAKNRGESNITSTEWLLIAILVILIIVILGFVLFVYVF